jgi:hypothetical protein
MTDDVDDPVKGFGVPRRWWKIADPPRLSPELLEAERNYMMDAQMARYLGRLAAFAEEMSKRSKEQYELIRTRTNSPG